jgi:hypothetical protein
MLTLAIRWGPEEVLRQTGDRLVGGDAADGSIGTCATSSHQGKRGSKEGSSSVQICMMT